MLKKLCIAAALFLTLLSSVADARFPRGSYQDATVGWNGGKAQMNVGDVIYGGGYEFVNALLNAEAWSAADNSGAVPSNELDSNGYPIPGTNIMTARSGVCTVFYQPNPNDGGYTRAVQVTGKGTVVANGTILTTATQSSPITITSITGGNGSTVVNFSGAHLFSVGMEAVFSSITGTIASTLNGNVFVVASMTSTSITITTGNLTGQSGSAGTVDYGRTAVGVATGGRYIFQWPNPPPTENGGGVVRGTLCIYTTDAVSPVTKVAIVPIGSEEARYNANNLAFSQKHLDVVNSGKLGVQRNLNVVHGNYSNEVTWAQRKPTSYYSFGAPHSLASIYQASPTGAGHDYTAASGSGTPPDKMQITTSFPAATATCGGAGGAAMTLTFSGAAPMGVNDAFFIYQTFGSGALPTNTATGQPLSIYPAPFYATAVSGSVVQSFSATKGGASIQVSSCGAATLQAHVTEMDEAVTFTGSSDIVTWTAHPPLSVGDPVACAPQGGSSVGPSNLDPYKLSYFVQSVPNANSVKLAATNGGAAITWATSTVGTTVCVRQPTMALSGGSAYPIRDTGFQSVSYGGNSQPLAKCFSQNFCQGTLTFDSGIGAWSLFGANRATGSMAIANNWPPEAFLQYAIETHAQPWVVSPQYTLDPVTDYMPSLLKMYKDGAPSWMTGLRVEPINECWNGSFSPTIYTIFKSKANWPASTVNGYNVNAECGKMTSTLGQVAQQVYGGGTVGNGYHMVLGVQTGLANATTAAAQYDERMNTTLYSGQTPGTQQANLTGSWGTITFSLNPAYNYVTAVAVANYFSSAVYGTSQETTWSNDVTIFIGTVTGTTMTVTSVDSTYNHVLAAGDYLYGGFLNQNPTIVAQLTGTGGAACPHATCTGAVGTYQITQNLGTLQTNVQQMGALNQTTAGLYVGTFGGMNATCSLAAGTLTVSGIDYTMINEARNFGPPIVTGSGIDLDAVITGAGGSGGGGGNGTYPMSNNTQTLGARPCQIGLFTVPSVKNYHTNIYNWKQGFTNLAGAHPTLMGYEGGFSPDFPACRTQACWALLMLRYFAKMPAAIGTYSTQNQNNFIAAGGVWPSQFNFTGPQPSGLVWSVLEDIYQTPTTPLWQSLKTFSTP